MQVNDELKQEWDALVKRLEVQFGEGIELEAILMLIGVQELGLGYKKFSKDEKIDVLHIALCTLLEPHGYYNYTGVDADGWPQWDAATALPSLKVGEQTQLVKQSIIEYFKEMNEE